MTKLYPELSAKLGLTKHSPNENTTHKNGITLRESVSSTPVKKVEGVTDESRIKLITTGQIVSSAKGIIATKLGNNGVQSTKSNSVKPSKPKLKSGERGQRRTSHGGHSRTSGGRFESLSQGSLHTSSHGLGPSPTSKGPSLASGTRSTNSSVNNIRLNTSTASSILEEQLRGGAIQRPVTTLALSPDVSSHHLRLAQPASARPVATSAPLSIGKSD